MATVGAIVDLYDNGSTTPIATATVGNGGTWTTNVTLSGAGTNSIVAQDIDAAGNTGISAPVVFTLPNFTIQWTGQSGNWDIASNWSTGTVPGSLDDVLIGVPANVTFSTGSTVVDQLNSAVGSVMTMTGGTNPMALSLACTSSPLMPGILTSRRTQPPTRRGASSRKTPGVV